MDDKSDADSDPARSIYNCLDNAQQQIRVLQIQKGLLGDPIRCELRTISLNEDLVDLISFEALSYVWGREHSPIPIFLEGQPYKITANLYSALRNLRQPEEERTIWIDALCINQEDTAERSQQVSMMQRIYCQAKTVIAWLGEPEGPDDQVLLALRILKEISTIEETRYDVHWGQRIASFRSEEPHVYSHLLGYSQSFHLISWPDVGGLHDELFGADHMAKLREEYHPHRIWPPPTHSLGTLTEKSINSAIITLCQLEYWQRIWTLQEIVLPPNSAWLVRGHYRLEADIAFAIFNSMKWHVGDCCTDFARTHSSFYKTCEGLARMATCRKLRMRNTQMDGAAENPPQDTDAEAAATTTEGNAHKNHLTKTFERGVGHHMMKNYHLHLDRIHVWFGTRKATNARDHVYGLFGLLGTSYNAIVPDYTSSINNVFSAATMACVTARKDLRILELVSATHKTTHYLPSWAMDFLSAEKQPNIMLRLPSHLVNIQEKLYNASRAKEAQCWFSEDRERVGVHGVYLGSILDYVPPASSISPSDDVNGKFALVET